MKKSPTFIIYDHKFLVQSPRRTGFVGLLVCIASVKALYVKYVNGEDNTLKWLPTYKLTQDPLELSFGVFRRRCGSNTNPSPKQFEAAYKSLLVKNELRDITNGNCFPQDDLPILEVMDKKSTPILETSKKMFEQFIKHLTGNKVHNYQIYVT